MNVLVAILLVIGAAFGVFGVGFAFLARSLLDAKRARADANEAGRNACDLVAGRNPSRVSTSQRQLVDHKGFWQTFAESVLARVLASAVAGVLVTFVPALAAIRSGVLEMRGHVDGVAAEQKRFRLSDGSIVQVNASSAAGVRLRPSIVVTTSDLVVQVSGTDLNISTQFTEHGSQ